MKYLVEVTETFARHVIVDAKDMQDATNIVQNTYENGDIVLDYEDFYDTYIHCLRKACDEDSAYYEEVK